MPAKPAKPSGAKPKSTRLKSAPPKDRPLTADEQRFIHSYVKVGGIEEKIELAERRIHLKPGAGRRMLGRAPVLAEVHLRMEPVRMEQMRQQMLGDTVAEVTKRLEEKTAKAQADAAVAERELSAIIACPEKLKCRPDLLEDALMRMALGLDQALHPGVKLDAIRSAFVVAGIMEQGTTRRVVPPEGGSDAAGSAGIYQGLFVRLRAERGLKPEGPGQPPPPPETVEGKNINVSAIPAENRADLAVIRDRVHELTHPKPEEPYDLMPRSQSAADSEGSPGAPVALPVFGEPVDELTPPPGRRGAGKASKSLGQVFTVEVG